MPFTRRLTVVTLTLCLLACGGGSGSFGPPRYLMGFSAIPPKPDPALQMPTLDLTLQHSNAGLIQLSIPWAVLLAGTTAPDEVEQVRLPLVD